MARASFGERVKLSAESSSTSVLHPQRKKMQKKGPNRLQSSVKRRGDGSGQFWGKG